MLMQNVVEPSKYGTRGQSSDDLGMRSFFAKEMVEHDRAKKPKEHTDFRGWGCKGSFKRSRFLGVRAVFKTSNNKGNDRLIGAEAQFAEFHRAGDGEP